MMFMRSDDPNPRAGPLWKRDDHKTSTSALMCLQQEQGKGVPHIPMQMRTRQHNALDPTIQRNLEGFSQNWQHRLHPLLRHGHKTRHGGIRNTGKNHNCGESGNQKKWQDQKWWEKWQVKTTDDSCSHQHQETDSGRILFQLKLP